jgi:hypothetical protein
LFLVERCNYLLDPTGWILIRYSAWSIHGGSPSTPFL